MPGESSKKTETINQTTRPLAEAMPMLNSILGSLGTINPALTPNETGAIDGMTAMARRGNPFLPGIQNVANMALSGGPDRTGMVSDSYSRYLASMSPTASGDFLDPNKNPWFSQVTQSIGNDVQQRINAMYAGAGRDPSGAGSYAQNLGRGVAEGVAPVFANVYGQERANQLNAINGMNTAGNQAAGVLAGLDQNAMANRMAGIDASTAALNAEADPFTRMLAAEAMKRGIPLDTLRQLAGITTPIASLGSTTNGTNTTTQETSGDPLKAILGAGIAGLGIASGFGAPMLGAGGLSSILGFGGAVDPIASMGGSRFIDGSIYIPRA